MDFDITNGNEIVKFWKKLRGNNEPHNYDVTATWISDVSECLTDMVLQRDIVVTESVVGKAVKGLKSWKAAGLDGVHKFRIKHLTLFHPMMKFLNG